MAHEARRARGEADPAEPAAGKPRATRGRVRGRGLVVLVVEDNEDLRETLALMLQIVGHTCLLAANGEMALQIAKRTSPRSR